MTISGDTTLEELAAIICTAMSHAGHQAVLVGGSVVSIWSHNAYQSHDLDFITTADPKQVDTVMAGLGFRRSKTRHYEHPEVSWLVEFPAGPLAIGEERITRWERKATSVGTIELLAATECVMDRLAEFFHWSDRQALRQAVLVSRHQPVRQRRIKAWAQKKGAEDKYETYREALARAGD